MITESERRHADLMASFLSNLSVALLAGAMLQLTLVELPRPATVSLLLMTAFAVYGVAHIVLHRVYGTATE